MIYNPKAKFVSAAGGVLLIGDPETGETAMTVAIPPGVVSMSQYSDFVGLGEWNVSEGVAIVKPRSGYVVQQAPGRKDTGANPDWQPSVHTQMQRQMESIVKKMLPRAIKDQARQRQIEKLSALGKMAGLTQSMGKEMLGVTPGEHKKMKGLGEKDETRDHMDRLELAIVTLGEQAAKALVTANDPDATGDFAKTKASSMEAPYR